MTRMPTRTRRLALFSTVIAGTIAASSACGVGPAPGGGPEPSATVAAPPSASASAPAPSPPSALPDGWRLCTNTHLGYGIGYPENWYTAALGDEDVCGQFHPTSFTIPPFSERPLTALNVVQTSGHATPTDPTFARTLLWEDTFVGGRAAIRFEEEFTGAGLYEQGTMRYGYVIDPNGRPLNVYTMAPPGAETYVGWKHVVDQAVHTLTVAAGAPVRDSLGR